MPNNRRDVFAVEADLLATEFLELFVQSGLAGTDLVFGFQPSIYGDSFEATDSVLRSYRDLDFFRRRALTKSISCKIPHNPDLLQYTRNRGLSHWHQYTQIIQS